ncbi:uncharacterized protein RCO7_01289 [Rhynchosporium graminicola]|uniref:Uncharacterized protein n=1 Tax=Rhynchosporium graminicola TaxID=2792576 RepID=A0A1E1K4V3_9HELO|nr:uncharacterized protein RCO7_01289 [Rhynchosporium commune]
MDAGSREGCVIVIRLSECQAFENKIKRLVAELGSGEYDLMREWILSASGVHRNLWHSWPEFIKRETDVIVEQKIPDVEMMSMQEGKQEGLDSVGCWTSGKKGLGQATYLQGSMKESMNSVHASEDSAILPDLGDQTVDSSRYQDSLGARDGEMPPSDAAAFARMRVQANELSKSDQIYFGKQLGRCLE